MSQSRCVSISSHAIRPADRPRELPGTPPFGGTILSHDFVEAALLRRAVASKQRDELDNLRATVEKAGATLFHVLAGDRLIGAAVLRVDHLESGPEGVIVAAAGRLPGVRLLDLLAHFEHRLPGVTAIRIHTSRPGMVRSLTRAGYEVAETVLRKPCSATA